MIRERVRVGLVSWRLRLTRYATHALCTRSLKNIVHGENNPKRDARGQNTRKSHGIVFMIFFEAKS